MAKKKRSRGADNPIAYVDESVSMDPSLPEGQRLYTMTGVVVDPGAQAWMNTHMREVAGDAFHANKAKPQEVSAVIAEVAAEKGVRSIVTVRSAADPKNFEDTRKDCLAELSRRLSRSNVRLMVMDDRSNGTGSTDLNDRDRATIQEAKGAGLVRDEFQIEFGKGTERPMLHAADAIGWQVRRGIERNEPSRLTIPLSAPEHMQPQEKMRIVEAPKLDRDAQGRLQRPAQPQQGASPASQVTALQARLENLTQNAAKLAPTAEQARIATNKALTELRAEERQRLTAKGKGKSKGKGKASRLEETRGSSHEGRKSKERRSR
ncbi:MAG: hypothetical protein GEV07_08420 [Streptosporangiales bacterium]|nr:hypothetical protein [Streptosporangiales bacterium]